MIDNQNEKALILFIKYKTKIAGVVSFNIIDHANKTAYIGYWLGANFQGKGIVTNAINKLIQKYGDSGVIKRFVIKCIVDNKKSNATALRCGFTLEGVLQKPEILNGVPYDQNIYSKVNARLKRQLAEQAEELTILQKAATYFAKRLK
ncbi:ribosomal-protein-serine acetyltransferase [Escherichia coli]|nr:ribosomal-protein-serine acetyltransferase [Escherichia coli]CAD6181106.1 ribosomal-protein-serine acetyltransferase [Escherichia coli]